MKQFWRSGGLAAWLALAGVVGSCGDTADGADCPEDHDAGGDSDADTDADSDADGDVDWDTDSDPFDPDSTAAAILVSGDFTECLGSFLSGGDAGAYAGYFETGNAAYFVWMDDWDGPSMRLRIESWPAWGGLSGPGSYTISPFDNDYDTCALCVFVETAASEYWLQPDGAVTFTEITTGVDGIGEPLAGTFTGELSDGDCSGTVEVSFSGQARDLTFGPL